MKEIKIAVQIPEKKDIQNNMDSFSNSQIQLFVNDFEGENYKKFWSKTRESESLNEFYSIKTATVYQIDKQGYFHKIFFVGNRPKNIEYGLDPNTRKARAYCTKCNTMLFSCEDLIGRMQTYCSCEESQKL